MKEKDPKIERKFIVDVVFFLPLDVSFATFQSSRQKLEKT